MKKIFLSLSAIALLAVGTVSCGSDDSNDGGGTIPPVVTPPVTTQAENTVRFNSADSPLDFSYYELITKNYTTTTGETVENVNVYQFPDGGYANGYYVNVGYNMTETSVDTYHYALILVPNPTIIVEGTTITNFGTPVLPHQAESIYWGQGFVEIGGVEYKSVSGNVGTGSVDVNTLVLAEDADENLVGTSNFVSQFTIGSNSFNFKFNGATFLEYYNVTTSAKGTTSVKAEMANNLKNLEVNAKTNTNVSLNK